MTGGRWLWRRWGIAVLLAALLAGCRGGGGRPAAPVPDRMEGEAGTGAEVLGTPLVIPAGLEVNGLDVGGLSGLVYLGENRYLAVSDNQGRTPARVFELAFAVGPEGPAPLLGRSAREVVTGVVRLQGLDGGNFDGEGVAATPWATVLVASETEPSIREMSPDGRLEATLPVGARFRKGGEGTGIGGNLGFESLALSPQGDRLWTGTERALEQDAPGAGNSEASPARLVRYRRAAEGFVVDGEFVYKVEAIEDPPVLGFRVRGLSGLAVLPDGRLLALEREFVTGRGNRVQIYAVSLVGHGRLGLRGAGGADGRGPARGQDAAVRLRLGRLPLRQPGGHDPGADPAGRQPHPGADQRRQFRPYPGHPPDRPAPCPCRRRWRRAAVPPAGSGPRCRLHRDDARGATP